MSDSPKIVALNGASTASLAGEAEPDVVAYCEGLLERAKRGETIAVATVEAKRGTTVSYGYSNPAGGGHGHRLLSGLYTLMRQLDDNMLADA